MYTVELPYSIGTFVKIVDPVFERQQPLDCGTVSCYIVGSSSTDIIVCVSGYKEPWYGEYLATEIEPMTDEEIEQVKLERESVF